MTSGEVQHVIANLVPPVAANACRLKGSFTPEAGAHYVMTAHFNLAADNTYTCRLSLQKKSVAGLAEVDFTQERCR